MKKTKPSFFKNLIIAPFKFLILLLQLAIFAAMVFFTWFILQITGVFGVQVPVSGASMLPTLPEEGYVEFQRYYPNEVLDMVYPQNIQRGDIVVFENDQTHEELAKQNKGETGFVKRVIGLPGDVVEIKDGYVFVNGEKKAEEYTLKPRSTFGNIKVQDCQEIRVEENHVFVLGDNRKVSMDSRQIGTVPISDISYYIPFGKQENKFGSSWRDSSHDFDTEQESLFDVKEFVSLLNKTRIENNLNPLEYDPHLEKSAELRAKYMLENDEFGDGGKNTGYTIKDAMKDAGYSNIVYGEFPMMGYYTAGELYESFIQQPGSSEFLLNKDYDDIGVSTFIGELNNCPVQIVVQHLGGYIPPNYSKSDIEGWEVGLQRLIDIQPSWQSLREYEEFYQLNKKEIDQINDIIDTRIARFSSIASTMKNNEWLTEEQKKWIEDDKTLSQEQNRLADMLNKKN